MELGRIILLTDGQRYAIMRVTWLTKVFVAGDVVAFLVQMMGESSPIASRCIGLTWK